MYVYVRVNDRAFLCKYMCEYMNEHQFYLVCHSVWLTRVSTSLVTCCLTVNSDRYQKPQQNAWSSAVKPTVDPYSAADFPSLGGGGGPGAGGSAAVGRGSSSHSSNVRGACPRLAK